MKMHPNHALQGNYARRLMALYHFLSRECDSSVPALREKLLMGARQPACIAV